MQINDKKYTIFKIYNTMRKLFLTFFATCLALGVMAVELPKQGFGLQIGWAQPVLRLNSPNNPSSAKDSLTTTVKMNGFKIGLVYDASYIAGFGSSMGLNYTFGAYNGGWVQRNPGYGDYPRDRQLITYNELEVFVDWQYKFEVAKETYLMLYTGPTIQCGLTLTMRKDSKIEDIYTGEISTLYGERFNAYKADASSTTPDTGGFVEADNAFTRLNVTWGVGAGFQYKRYFLRGGYDFGLVVPFKNKDFANGYHARGRLDQWSVKIGMYLWYSE